MPSVLHNLKHSISGIDWLGVARIVTIQLIVLGVLSLAVVRFIDWSSEVARAEFAGTTTQTASVATKRAPCSSD